MFRLALVLSYLIHDFFWMSTIPILILHTALLIIGLFEIRHDLPFCYFPLPFIAVLSSRYFFVAWLRAAQGAFGFLCLNSQSSCLSHSVFIPRLSILWRLLVLHLYPKTFALFCGHRFGSVLKIELGGWHSGC